MTETATDPSLWLTIAAILLLLVCSAFFSGSETALTASSRGKLSSQADDGSTRAALALKLTQDGERLIGSILMGNTLVNILATSLATAVFARFLGEGAVPIAALVMTALVLIFSEVMPKTYAIANAEAERLRGELTRKDQIIEVVKAHAVHQDCGRMCDANPKRSWREQWAASERHLEMLIKQAVTPQPSDSGRVE